MKICPMQAQPCSTVTHKIYARALMLTVSQSEGLKRKSGIVLSICEPNPHVNIFSMCPITVMSKIEQLTYIKILTPNWGIMVLHHITCEILAIVITQIMKQYF